MTPERWRQIEELFHAAAERGPEERAAFLEQACAGDQLLRKEVESLLTADSEQSAIEALPSMVAAAWVSQDRHRKIVGQTMGRYRVVSPLGVGGMGEVYLAEDTSLNRKVALKLLPHQFTEDRERVLRFEREARAASALNHPNILTIYEIGQFDDIQFIATEFVDGKTLRQWMTEERNLQQSIEVGIQIASALAAAHNAGIVHRDVKPANIMVRSDGLVKVLDFGLAKLTTPANKEITSAELTADGKTEPGRVMGTVHYMSPEQALGQALDHRTDIFSLGVVLYEMFSGEQPFQGESDAAFYSALLNRTPRSITDSQPGIPVELERIIKRALEKDRELRYQTASDLRSELKRLERDSASGQASTAQTAEIASGQTTSSAEYLVTQVKGHKRLAALAATLVIVGLVFGLYWTRSRDSSRAINPFQSPKIDRLTAHGLSVAAAISPDGKYVAYAKDEGAKQSLWLRQVAIAGDTQIVPPSEADYQSLTFSRDGNFLYFVASESGAQSPSLYQITTLGRNQRKLITGVSSQISFSPDGKQLAFVRQGEGEHTLVIADAEGSNERTLATQKFPDTFTEGVTWSPDGKLIACTTLKRRTRYGAGVISVNVESGEQRSLTDEKFIRINRAAWLADGSGLILCVYTSPTGQRYQLRHLSYPGGELQNVTNDLSSYEDLSLRAGANELVAVQREYSMSIWIAPEGDSNRAAQIHSRVGRDDGERGLCWTPEDRLVYVSSEGDAQNLWLMDADGGNQRPLTPDPDHGYVSPALSYDGRYLLFMSDLENRSDVWRMDTSGGNRQRVTDDRYAEEATSSDGKWVVYSSSKAGKSGLWRVPIDGGAAVQLTSNESSHGVISPDGRFVVCYYKDDRSPQRIAILSIDDGTLITKLACPPTVNLAAGLWWAQDGKAIMYVNTVGTVSNLWLQPINGGAAKPLTDFRENQITAFAWSPDGKQLALSRGVRTKDVVVLR